MPTRRAFLKTLAAASAGSVLLQGRAVAADEKLPPVKALTTGPACHWFAYYDKLEFDPTGRYVLSNEVSFEHRSPKADDKINVGMVDLNDNNRWTELGESSAWNWQQGCMLQWIPGTKSEVMWNDRQDGQFVCHILDVKTSKKRTIPHPVYTLSPDGRWGLAPDFRRLNDMRPGYGYAGIPDPNKDVLAPEDAGIWKIDMQTGEQKLLLSFAAVAAVAQAGGFSKGAKHWFNHLLVSPDGARFEFLHRWRGAAEGGGWKTRMFTANADGKDLFLINASGKVSHFIWRDPTHIAAYAGFGEKEWRFQVFEDKTGKAEEIEGMLKVDGHCTYLPGNQWMLCDTYPDKQRNQNAYLLHLATKRFVPLGHFLLPKEYAGEWRCDTHPRFSPDGKKVVIDSPHGGNGRQLYLIDISDIVRG
ncbi:MAG TPA: hypothetical protein VGP72_30335 [Planctomycetota bacterium]|jgi:hypothetical protein